MKKILLLAVITAFACHERSDAQNNSKDSTSNALGVSFSQNIGVSSPYTIPISGQSYGVAVGYLINMKKSRPELAKWIKDVDLEFSYINLYNVNYINAKTGHPFGSIYAGTASIEIPIVRIGPAQIIISPGIGPAITTKDFYNTNYTNGTNYAFGSSFNIESKVDLEILAYGLRGTFGIKHFSNSDTGQPNCGLNPFGFSLGFVKSLHVPGPINDGKKFILDKKNSFNIQLIYGSQGGAVTGRYKKPDGTHIFADSAEQRKAAMLPQASLSFNYEHRFTSIFALTAGFDGIYSIKQFDWNRFFQTYESNYAAYGHITGGATAGAELWLGRMVFAASYEKYFIGHFVYGGNHPSGLIFSGRWHLTKGLALEGKAYSRRFGGAGILINPF